MLLKQIEYFQAVVESGNFYLAGDKCHISQSAISQQIKKLEEELNVRLLDRHNRTFTLTKAGEHFYRKSLVLMSDAKQLILDTKRIANEKSTVFRIGYYKGYHGCELSEAVSKFSELNPTVKISTAVGSHEELFYDMENNKVDLVLNDQRRAFSDRYHNEILSESHIYVEISKRNPLSKLKTIEIDELKNLPCILVINDKARDEEQKYYEDVIGIKGDYIFTDSMQDARLKLVTNQGYMPVDVIGNNTYFDTSIERIPLLREGIPVRKSYCIFWKKTNHTKYLEEFASFLRGIF